MHILERWEFNDVKNMAEQTKARLWELDALRSDVARLERTNAELSSCLDGLRATCEALLQRIERLEFGGMEDK